MKINALRYVQKRKENSQEYFSTVFRFDTLDKVTDTLIYGESEYGYQRKLNEKHYKKISKSILDSELISPTSIIVGVNKSDIDKILNHINDNIYYIDLSYEVEGKGIFRIIDGQHRINGLREAVKKDEEIRNYELSVIIMVINDDQRRIEAKVFKDINSKAKPLKMDLAILALYKYDLLEKVKEFDIKDHVGIKIAHLLNEEDGIWKNAIALDVNASNTTGCVGFKTFYESIKSICDIYVHNDEINKLENCKFEEIIEFVDKKSKEIVNRILDPCWVVVEKKWKKCFTKNTIIYNFEESEIRFNKKYYIQKTMGCKAINGLILEVLENTNGNIEEAILRFTDIIVGSKLEEEDWKVGKRFSGLSSEAGFKKIRKLIKNEIE